ncbi:MAG: exodeoxyribonuclease III [Candidatus Rokubacteria bacterium]|nr:exodeoxyribonuclease III [Candidatus Rokubacteria bacterium]
MKVATWNVNGIRAREAQVREWIDRERPDVVCLQEIKAASAQVPESLSELPGYWCYWHAETSYSGVGLHVRQAAFPDKPVFGHPAFDYENRIVTAQLGTLVVASVYVPNGGKDFPAKMKFLEAMDGYVAEAHAEGWELVLCGDMNVTRTDMDVHPKERKAGAIGQRPEERELLERILARGLTDVGRALDPENDRLFTWWAPWRNLRQRNIGWRIDYVLASEPLARRASTCAVLAEVGTSDHAPLVATFASRVAGGAAGSAGSAEGLRAT